MSADFTNITPAMDSRATSVSYFDPFSMSVCPDEAQAPLPTDAYAVLAESISLKGFQLVARRHSQKV